jgi:flagellin
MDRYFQKEISMAFSINTNRGAMVALQSLNATNKGLDQVQKRVSTGLSVASTKDDSATFVTAQTLRGKTSDLKAVTSSLTNAKSVVDVATSGVEQISDIANQMRTLAKQAADTTISDQQRAAYDSDFGGLKNQITTIINASEFNGTNLLKTPSSSTASGSSVSALQSLAPAASSSSSSSSS